MFPQKAHPQNSDTGKLSFREPSLEVSLQRHTVRLTRKEFRILLELYSEPCRAWSREELLLNVWGRDVFVDSRTIDRHIVRLRRKLKDLHEPTLTVDTVWGIGYRLRAPGIMQD